jgi:hypothetical protein
MRDERSSTWRNAEAWRSSLLVQSAPMRSEVRWVISAGAQGHRTFRKFAFAADGALRGLQRLDLVGPSRFCS